MTFPGIRPLHMSVGSLYPLYLKALGRTYLAILEGFWPQACTSSSESLCRTILGIRGSGDRCDETASNWFFTYRIVDRGRDYSHYRCDRHPEFSAGQDIRK